MSDGIVDPKIDDYKVVLPCAPSEFGSFIASLLGKPKEVKGSVSGFFNVDQKHIANFYHLINQRVSLQNQGSLINLSITTLYANGTSVTHHNPSDFENYYPIAVTHPVQVIISFTYLLKFNSSLTAEKQEIEIVLSTESERGHSSFFNWTHSGVCRYSVSHTDTSWAADIANIINSHAESLVEKPSAKREFFNEHYDEILKQGTRVIYAVVILVWCYISNQVIGGNDGYDEYLKYFANSLTVLAILSVVFKSVTDLVLMNISLRRSSFICLVDKDYKRMEAVQRKESGRWRVYVGSWLINIACSLVAAYIFTIL
ncbi:hypothetical protein [Pseudomonas sp. EA_105y_Pfl2_R69]|uniref:hypothetical protein n=1 Tax=Pseudomonas sp. EA_105y_Pfl2_R69 TaxID=3088683 RepID=UPI0030D9B102